MNVERIRVLLVTTTDLFGGCLYSHLDHELDLDVAIVTSGLAAIADAQQQPAVVVLDAALPQLNVTATIRQLAELAPASCVVLLLTDAAATFLHPLGTAGITSMVLRSTSPATLVEFIRAAARGDGYYPQEVVTTALRAGGPGQPPLSLPTDVVLALTTREREIVDLMTELRSHSAVADRLRITPAAVKTYCKRIRRKVTIAANRATMTPYT